MRIGAGGKRVADRRNRRLAVTLAYAPRMTEAEKRQESFAAARRHAGYEAAMRTKAPTWLGIGVLCVLLAGGAMVANLFFYPWDEMSKMPGMVKPMLYISWIPAIGGVLGSLWLLFDALALSAQPTRHVLAVVGKGVDGPAPFYLRLIDENGEETTWRARRRAGTAVKLRLLEPGEAGVAVFKGSTAVEWVSLAPQGRVYDRS